MGRKAVLSLPPEEAARVVNPAERRRGLLRRRPAAPVGGRHTRVKRNHP